MIPHGRATYRVLTGDSPWGAEVPAQGNPLSNQLVNLPIDLFPVIVAPLDTTCQTTNSVPPVKVIIITENVSQSSVIHRQIPPWQVEQLSALRDSRH